MYRRGEDARPGRPDRRPEERDPGERARAAPRRRQRGRRVGGARPTPDQRLRPGGERGLDPARAGAFYHPTLLAVSDSSLPIVQEETFGPVQTVQVFDTEDEAVALANDTDYGLSACVWTRDADRLVRLARRLDAGLVSVNSWANLTVEFEEGGFKSSGVGRLGGVAFVEDFLEHKQITQDFGSWG